MMTTRPLAEKVRAGRRAALAALNARLAASGNVVSFYEGRFPVRQAVPEFRSVRRVPAPVLVLTERIAA